MGRRNNGFKKRSFAERELQFEDEELKIRPWMIPVFAGVLVIVMLLCVLIWGLTHRGEREVGGTDESGAFSVIIEEEETEESAEESIEESLEESVEESEEESVEASEGETEASNAVDESTDSDEAADTSASDEASGGDSSEDAKTQESGANEESLVQEPISGDTSMSFTAVEESVTAKDVLNLRSAPTTADAENVVAQLKNGESAKRIGINQTTGWSKLEYNGQTVYAVSQYLTTDLGYKPPVQKTNPNRVNTLDGRVIIFTDCDDYISPKEYVNLRLEPSTSEGNATVHARLNYGEVVHRTGYSPDAGWSRVEYNGQVVYVVTSYMITVTVEE